MEKTKKLQQILMLTILCCLVVIFLIPIFFVVMNSFKGKLYISDDPFSIPVGDLFVGLENYIDGISNSEY